MIQTMYKLHIQPRLLQTGTLWVIHHKPIISFFLPTWWDSFGVEITDAGYGVVGEGLLHHGVQSHRLLGRLRMGI